MKIGIIGWYGQNNVGDEAFRVVFEDLFKGHELVFVRPPADCPPCDIAILGGGAVTSPFYLEKLPDCPRYAMGVDIAYASEINLIKAANFKEIYVRSHSDAAKLQEAGLNAHWIPDLAFYLQPSGADILSKYRQSPSKKAIGVFVTDYVNPAIDRPVDKFSARANQFIVGMAAELDRLAGKGHEILLVPCSTGGYGDDRRINLDLAAFMKYQPTNILETIDPQEMVDLISQLDVAVCMRFHSHIFAEITGTPFVSVEFTRKVEMFLEEHQHQTKTAVRKQADGFFDFTNFQPLVQTSLNEKSRSHNVASGYRETILQIRDQVLQSWLQSRS